MKKLILISLIIGALFSSCKKEPDPPVKKELTDAMARDSLYYLMRQWYYWYDLMPDVEKNNYKDPYELMNAMRYRPIDRWSVVVDYNEFIAEMQGDFVGHGIRIGIDDQEKARIAMIFSRSPLYSSGVRRGWVIKSVNGTDIAPIIISGDAAGYNNVMGPSQEGITNRFVFTKPDGTDIEISSTKTTFMVNSVLHYDTLHLSSGITGHLVFESFIEPSVNELTEAFAFFKANDVKDIVLDLRYNGGGYLYVAQALASYIAGNSPASANEVFTTLRFNNKNLDQNTSFTFKATSYPMSVTRLVVITSRMTASASEAVMNGLLPFMDIISIGDTTNGKPVGMQGWEVGQKYFFLPITYKTVNKNNEGDYFDGFAPEKLAPDDITHDFDSRDELCLREAIRYLETGTFYSKRSAAPFYRYPQYSEKPGWMNNVFTERN